MVSFELDEDDFLVTPEFENGPAVRTWRQCLEDIGELQPEPTPERLKKILELYGLEDEGELSNEVPFDRLCELITWEIPSGAAYFLLSSFESDPRASGIIEFYESPSIGSEFIGVKLIGSRLEFRRLLRMLGLSDDAHLPLECEIYASEARTEAGRAALRAITPEEIDEKIDYIEAVPLVEEYIDSGEPELQKYVAMKYGSALEEIPIESELYQSIAKQLGKNAAE